jgi:hypothetical protein
MSDLRHENPKTESPPTDGQSTSRQTLQTATPRGHEPDCLSGHAGDNPAQRREIAARRPNGRQEYFRLPIDRYPHLPYPPKPHQRRISKAMTIVAGFRCYDGVLLCADAEITLTQNKTYQAKIFKIQPDAYLAYTGDVDFVRELVDILRRATAGRTGRDLLTEARRIYREFYRKHYTQPPKSEKTYAHILMTAREKDTIILCSGAGRHWSEVDDYQLLGIGREQGETLLRPLYEKSMGTGQVGYLAIYAIARIKGFVQGCGGKTHMRELLDDPAIIPWPRWVSADKIKRIERDFEFFDKEILPLAISFTDTGTDRKAFQEVLTATGKRLKTHRVKTLRNREPLQMGSWLKEWKSSQI